MGLASLLLPLPAAYAQRTVGGGGGGTGGGGTTPPSPTPTPPNQTTGWWIHQEGQGTRAAAHNLYPTPMPYPSNWTTNGQASESFSTLAFDGHNAEEGTSANTSGTITVICTWMGNSQEMPEKVTLVIDSTASVKIGALNLGMSNTVPQGYTITASNGLGDARVPLSPAYWGSQGKQLKTYATSGAAIDGYNHMSVRVPISVSASGSYGPINNTDTSYIEASAQVSATPIAYSLAVDAGGNEGTQTGTPGHYAGFEFRDGTYQADPNGPIDPNTGSPLQSVPSQRYLAPNERHFYAVVSATVTLPDDVTPQGAVTVKARRIRYVNGVIVPASDGTKSLTLNVVTQSDNGKPVPHPSTHTITYTYRTHDLEDNEQVPYRIPGSADQVIDDWLGRWQFYMEDLSNRPELKIDKRGQLVTWACDWANFWPHRPESSKKYDDIAGEHFLSEQVYLGSNGTELFTQCHSFVAYVYNRMGLYVGFGTDPTGDSIQTTASAIDDYPGAIRCFPSHSGLITGRGLLYGGEMVDDYNPQADVGDKGVGYHDWDLGGTPDTYPNRTMPDPAGAPDPDVAGRTKSFLKVLDVE